MSAPSKPRPAPRLFKRSAWALEYAAYRSIEAILRLLPVAAACGLGSLLGRLAWYLLPRRRALVLRNLRIAFGRESSLDDLRVLAARVFRRTGSNLIAAVKTATLRPEQVRKTVEIDGLELLEQALAGKRGVIFLLPHQGNWELLAQLGPVLVPGIPSAAMYRPLSNPRIDALVRRRRQRLGTTLISNRDGPLAAISHLREGGGLGLLADQQAGYHGSPAVFFTRLASLTPLPLILARRTGAPIVPLAMRQDRPGKWHIRLFPALQIDDFSDTTPLARAYERIIRWAPVDYFWLQDPWKVSNRAPLRLARAPGKRATPPLPGSFPVLLHLPPRLAGLPAALLEARPDLAPTLLVALGDPAPAGVRVLRYDRSWSAARLAAELRAHEDDLPVAFEAALLLTGERCVGLAAARAGLRCRIGTPGLEPTGLARCLPADLPVENLLGLLGLATAPAA